MVTFYPCRAFYREQLFFSLKTIGSRLLTTFANSLDPDQDDLDFKPLNTLLVFLKESADANNSMKNYPACKKLKGDWLLKMHFVLQNKPTFEQIKWFVI